MITNCRFALDEKRYVIDLLNPANSGKGYCHEGDPEDDRYLRESVLRVRLGEMLDKLIINLRPMQKLPSGEEYKPHNEESFAISWTMLDTIRASHLNTFDPVLSIQHKFDGKLRCQKKHTQDFTSLALFRDDVECLLRDLYGDVESEALDSILRAVLRIVEQFAKFVRPDLWKEHSDAEDLDYMFGIGVPDGCAINGSDWRRGMAAKADLILRVCEVDANPSTFNEYTVEFAKRFGENWVCSSDAASEAWPLATIGTYERHLRRNRAGIGTPGGQQGCRRPAAIGVHPQSHRCPNPRPGFYELGGAGGKGIAIDAPWGVRTHWS